MSMHPNFLQLTYRHFIGDSVRELDVFVETLQEGDYLDEQCATCEKQFLLENFRHDANPTKQEVALTFIVITFCSFNPDSDWKGNAISENCVKQKVDKDEPEVGDGVVSAYALSNELWMLVSVLDAGIAPLAMVHVLRLHD